MVENDPFHGDTEPMDGMGWSQYMRVSNESLGKEITVMKCHEPFGYESEHVRTIYCTMANSKTAAGTFGGLPPKPHIEKPLANSTALPKKKQFPWASHHLFFQRAIASYPPQPPLPIGALSMRAAPEPSKPSTAMMRSDERSCDLRAR